MKFLTAEWRKLILVNYEIDPKILEKYLPIGTELDFYQEKCWVSLVGFMFLNTKLLGVSVPFHKDFEEVNLRFYVKRLEKGIWKRGVVFIKEIVPKRALSFVANTFYEEHYEYLPMNHEILEDAEKLSIQYSWKKNNWNSMKVIAKNNPLEMIEGSDFDFISEHYFGYTKSDGKTYEYEVKHPKWKNYEILNSEINVDFEEVYGQDFEILNHTKPTSIMLAEGSEIEVHTKKQKE